MDNWSIITNDYESRLEEALDEVGADGDGERWAMIYRNNIRYLIENIRDLRDMEGDGCLGGELLITLIEITTEIINNMMHDWEIEACHGVEEIDEIQNIQEEINRNI